MKTQMMSLSDIRQLGLSALTRALGSVGMVRFLQQFERGSGDYTKERARILKDMDVRTIVREIKDKRRVK